jgi:hypothetical protein
MVRSGPDEGATLAELLVAMSVMATVAAIGTAGIVRIYRTLDASEAQTTAQQQLTTSFGRLDREVRYATAVSLPGTVNGDYYVEYLIGTTGTPNCVELRLHTATAQLQRRTWPNGSPASASPWLPLASGVSAITAANGQVAPPFALTPATAVLNYERLQVSLTSHVGAGSTASDRESTVTWAALNAARTAATDVCIEGRSIP